MDFLKKLFLYFYISLSFTLIGQETGVISLLIQPPTLLHKTDIFLGGILIASALKKNCDFNFNLQCNIKKDYQESISKKLTELKEKHTNEKINEKKDEIAREHNILYENYKNLPDYKNAHDRNMYSWLAYVTTVGTLGCWTKNQISYLDFITFKRVCVAGFTVFGIVVYSILEPDVIKSTKNIYQNFQTHTKNTIKKYGPAAAFGLGMFATGYVIGKYKK